MATMTPGRLGSVVTLGMILYGDGCGCGAKVVVALCAVKIIAVNLTPVRPAAVLLTETDPVDYLCTH